MRIFRNAVLASLAVLLCVLFLTASIPNVPTGTWQTWNVMTDARSGASAALLSDGRVLIAGGANTNGPIASADLFGTDGVFSAAATMNSPRSNHTATLLGDGRVLVTGGDTGSGVTNSAEVYDPAAGSWTLLGATMVDARAGHTASLLPDGRVLLAGGHNSGGALSSLEIFDPLNDDFTSAGALTAPRMNHSAAVLGDGRVLVIGGSSDGTNTLATVDIYDPITRTVGVGPRLSTPRMSATATTTLDGKVAVIGGSNGSQDLASAEIFDPATGQFALNDSSLANPRSGQHAFLLPNNNAILIVGGSSGGSDLSSAELYSPWTDSFQTTGAMSVARPGMTGSAVGLDGRFLAGGGTALASTELYGFATLKTDQSDYAPGTIVTISGSGWQPGETVTLTLVESPLIDTHPQMTAVADGNGNISNNQFSPDVHDIDIRFYLTAVGSQSGLQAQNTFTDAISVNSVTVGPPTSVSVIAGAPASYSITVGFSGSGAACTANLSTTGLPAGAGSSFSTAAVTSPATSSTLTVTTTSSILPGSYAFTVNAAPSTGCSGNQTRTANATLVVDDQLIFGVQPSSTVSGATITPAVTVRVADNNGNIIPGNTASVTVAIGTNPSGGNLSGTKTVNAVNGVATFSNLSIDKAGTGYTLGATSTGSTSVTSNLFNITPGAANKLAFSVQPSNTAAGASITPPVQVQVQDANGNVVTGSSAAITIAIGTNPSSGTLSGTLTQNAVNGVATFSGLSIDKAGIGYTLSASSSGLASATSSTFNLTSGTATKLSFGTQPSNTAAGASISPAVTVQVQDANGNLVSTSTASVTIAIGTNPSGGTLSGTKTVNAVNGVATFNNLSIDKAGTGYTLSATSASLTSATSNPFDVAVGAANKLVFIQQPTNAAATQSITPAVTIQVQDASGNLVSTSTASIAVAIGTNPSSGTLSGTKTVSAVNGVATFSNLSIDKVGTGYTLTASSAGLTGTTSSAFNIVAGAAAQLAFVQQPTNMVAGASIAPAVTVQVQDAGGNPVTTSTAAITVAIGTNPGGDTLSGTLTQNAVGGIATFGNLSINKTGTGYTLTAGATSLTSATSTAFNITAGALDHFAFSSISSSQTAGTPFNITITAQDANNNTVTSFDGNGFKVNLTSTGTLVYTNPSPAFTNGVLANQPVQINISGNSVTITATQNGGGGNPAKGTSNSFTVNPAVANKLAFGVQPSNTQAGSSITPAVTVMVEDQFGNTVTSDTSNVSIGISSPGVFAGTSTTTVAAVNGVVTFSNLVPTKVGTGFTLSATDGALTGATSAGFNISAGAANKLVFSTPPSASASAGAAFAQQPVVTVQDQFGNTATGSSAPVLLTITSGTGTTGAALACATNPLAASAGLASFSGCSINLAGSGYTLTASSNGLTSAISSAINVSARSVLVTVTLTPSSVTTGSSSTMGVTVADTAGTGSSTPGGTIALSSSDATDTFTSTSCTLSGGSCSVSVTTHQLGGGSRTVTATYTPTDNIHSGNSGNANLTVTGTPPSINSAASTSFTAGSPGSFTVTTSGTPTPSLSEAGSLPLGVSFTDNHDGTATIAGTTNTANSFPIMITAQNGITPNATQNFTLTVNPGVLTSLTLSPSSPNITAGGSQPYTATGFDHFGNSLGDVTAATTLTVTNGICMGNSCSSTVAGSQTVTGNDNGATGTATLTVMPGAITHLALTPATATINAGASQGYTAIGLDSYNNPAGDVTSSTMFTISPSGSCTGASCTSNVADNDTVTGTYTNGSQGMATMKVNAGTFAQLQLLVPGETAAPGTATGKTGTPNVEYVNGPFKVIVNAVDQYFNVVNTVSDTVHFASNDNDPNTKLPSDTPLASGTGTFSVTLETVSYNPAKTTITVSDGTPNTSIQSDTSPALQVIIVYTASITPTMAGSGLPTTYTLTVNNAAAPNTNNLASVEIDVPTADQGTIIPSSVSVAATQSGGPFVNWTYDPSQIPAKMRFVENSSSDDVHPGGTITITFTATSNATVTSTPVSEEWTTTGYSDSASNNTLPLAPPEPTVQIGAAPKISSANTTTFTYGTAATPFAVTSTGIPTSTLSESGTLPSGVTFTDNGHGTATLAGTPGAAGTFPLVITSHNGFGPDDTQNFSLVVNKANQTITFGALPSKTYGDPDFTVSATSNSGLAVTFAASGNCTVSGNNVHITGAGSCTITASQAGDSNYNPAPDVPQSFTINKADVTISVTPYNVTYDGNPHTATGTAKGIGGVDLSTGLDLSGTTHTVAGTYTDMWTFTDASGNYNSASSTGTDIINKADPVVMAMGGTFTYDGNPHPGSGTATGVKGENLTFVNVAYKDSLNNLLTTAPINAGTYSVAARYAGDTNYNPKQSAAVPLIINKADAVISVAAYSATYDGNAHTATGTAKGVEIPTPADLTSLLHLGGTTHTNAGDYPSDPWTFDGNNNYNTASGTVHDHIDKANAVIVVTPYSVTYDSNPHSATGTAVGVESAPADLSSLLHLGGTSHTDAADYPSDAWTFDGNPNYNGTSGTVHDNIAKAPSTTSVNCPASVTYNGAPQTLCSASVTGVGGLSQSLTVTYTNNTSAGTATASASFTGDSNHIGSGDSKNFIINQRQLNDAAQGVNRTYDATTIATVTFTDDRVAGDSFSYSYVASFADKKVGTNKTVNVSNITISGPAAGNYKLASTTLSTTANISAAPASVMPNPNSKIFGSPDTVPLTTGILSGFFAADGITASYSRTTGEGVAGNPYTINATLSPSSALDNYVITYNTASFTISKASTTVSLSITPAPNNGTINNLVSYILNTPQTFSVTVTPQFSGTPTGTVTLKDGSTAIATITLSSGSGSISNSTLVSAIVGAHSLTAVYNGEANFSGSTSAGNAFNVGYAISGMCGGDAGHQILQPVNTDGSSVFKQGSTVPAKFRVCDANGVSIGTAGTISSFVLYQINSGVIAPIDETADYSTNDLGWRFDPTAQQWIFNMGTKIAPLNKSNQTYYFRITLNDGSTILFNFGLK